MKEVSFEEARSHFINGGNIKVITRGSGVVKERELLQGGDTSINDTEIYFGEWFILNKEEN